MILSPSMSLVAAGVATGICLFLLTSMRKGKGKDEKGESREVVVSDTRCGCCFKPFLVDRGIRCSDCNARICRKGCSRWDSQENSWHCIFCHQQRCYQKRKERWFETFGGDLDEDEVREFFSTAKSRVYVAGVENGAAGSGSSLAAQDQEKTHAMETIRDFVEKIVEGLIGNVDDTPINRLYDHPAYKPTTDPPTVAHTALRDIVERAVEEARKLPGLSNTAETRSSKDERTITEHSYEDLLATAILNKVIEKFQKKQVDSNSNVLHGKVASRGKRTPTESDLGLDEGVEEGCSSLEPLSQDECSDCSASCSRHVRSRAEPLSLTIEERIEEVTTTYTSDEEHRETDVLAVRNAHRVPFPELGMDLIDPSQESSEDSQDEPETPTPHVDMVSSVESWEENWLFQKKKVQTQTDSVAMLVPNPSADYKALIGDKDAEDTSDLSECSSAQSDEEIEKELMEAISNVVPRTPEKGAHSEEVLIAQVANGLQTENLSEKFANEQEYEGYIESLRPRNRIHQNDKDSGISTEKMENDRDENVRLYNYAYVTGYSLNLADGSKTKEVEVESNSCSLQNSHNAEPAEDAVTRKSEPEFNALNYESRTLMASMECDETGSIGATPESKTDAAKREELVEDAPLGFSDDQFEAAEETVVKDVPRTPACTPTTISPRKNPFESGNQAENVEALDESVLKSLERAKQKLMVTREDDAKKLAEEEVKGSTGLKVDLHVEDAQQESEYTEHYDIATQRHLDSLTKTDIPGQIEAINREVKYEDLPEKTLQVVEDNEESKRQGSPSSGSRKPACLLLTQETPEEETRLATPPRPGTIAEREHKKWENAPPIENNPYSPERIQKRLLERQYARRLSDIPGAHAELSKDGDLNDFTPNEPDITRFGRDYYINNAKIASGERGRRSGSSRPSSSLSQRSNSTSGGDHEPQDEPHYIDVDPLMGCPIDSNGTGWQKNNVESKKNDELIINKRVEEILENERKNNKNEINAKLNNQENNGTLETKSNSQEKRKKIRRIDLKAYGFENEFFMNSNKTIKTAPARVVNKLDLKSFGYDGGLRRCQSNNHLDSTVNQNDFKPRMVRTTNKLNITRHTDFEKLTDHSSLIQNTASGDNNLTQSTDELNKLHEDNYGFYGSLKSAKSVPNITKCEYYSNSSNDQDDELESCISQNSAREIEELSIIMNGQVVKAVRNYEFDKFKVENRDTGTGELKNSVNKTLETNICSSMDKLSGRNEKEELSIDKKLPMPSVRKLAQAFNKPLDDTSPPSSKVSKTNGVCKERSSTPEIQIVESPRQMHSLTARSLSKKFREGLRQIPNKLTSPPASHVTMEQSRIPEGQTDVVQSKGDSFLSDTDVISPGKLKTNIIFWEQIQRKS